MSKLSGQATPFIPKSSVGVAKLSAAAPPFSPIPKASSNAPPTAPAAPAPLTTTPVSSAALSKTADTALGLSATAAPYNPVRSSPTAKGTPAFPSASSSTSQPPSTSQPSPSANHVTEPAAPEVKVSTPVSHFAASSLVVKTPKKVNPNDAPKFSHSWGLICNNHMDPKNYTGVEIRRVGDIGQFWRLWHHVPLFSSKVSTAAGSAYTYHWFKGTIKPSWEDAANAGGGIMTIPMVAGDRVAYLDSKGKAVVDDVYMSIVMLATGAAKGASGSINGITIKSRNGVALDLWLDTTDADKIKALAAAVREVIVPLDEKYEKEKFAYMSNAQRVAAPVASSGYKGKAAKVEKKIEYY